ncbi:zinc-binding dehydrogenase [Amycolatopsis sp. NBC_01286]|uniref:zinc-binding dehydrogenase n=1 Tax=Amycolatopsis sp. NBC_01286 TaxID=2903560 RepID=UPI002E0F8BD6
MPGDPVQPTSPAPRRTDRPDGTPPSPHSSAPPTSSPPAAPKAARPVRELTGGHGTHVVLDAVGHMLTYEQAIGIVRRGGIISRVGVPQYEEAPIGFGGLFRHDLRLAGGPEPTSRN